MHAFLPIEEDGEIGSPQVQVVVNRDQIKARVTDSNAE
jgi:hypothetical protein